jgi:hypothetical protein
VCLCVCLCVCETCASFCFGGTCLCLGFQVSCPAHKATRDLERRSRKSLLIVFI